MKHSDFWYWAALLAFFVSSFIDLFFEVEIEPMEYVRLHLLVVIGLLFGIFAKLREK